MLAARIAMRASAPQVYDGRWSDSSGTSRTVSSGRIGGWPASGRGRLPVRCQPSSAACGSQSKVSLAPSSSTIRRPGGRKSRSAVSSVVLPAPPACAATISGTRPSISSHRVAASSASSVPARISSTMERGVGGTWRTAHRPRADEVSAKGISERSKRFPVRGGQRTADPVERQTLRCVPAPPSCRHADCCHELSRSCLPSTAWHSGSSRSPPTASPTSPRCSTRAATRNGAGAPGSGSAAGTGPTRRPSRTARSSRRRRRNRTTRRDSSRTRTTRSSAG